MSDTDRIVWALNGIANAIGTLAWLIIISALLVTCSVALK